MNKTTDNLRNIEILNEYKKCGVFQTVANKYGLTRQRVFQIVRRFGYTKPKDEPINKEEMRKIKTDRKESNRLSRFWNRVNKSQDGCWEWTGSKIPTGYGHLMFHNIQTYAHRVSWTLCVGEIPEGLCVLHHCDNPCCVRPDHLFLGTMLDNMHDRDAKGRNNKGKRIPRKSKTASCIS